MRSADPQIADRGSAFIASVDDPQPAQAPNVSWAIDGDAATIESPGASRDATAYVVPLHGGPAMLHAYLGPPVDMEVDTPIFAYRSLFVGCARRVAPIGVSFDSAGASVARVSQDGSDLYVRGTGCATPKRAAFALVAPLGTTFVATRALADFAAVSAKTWRAGGPTAFGFETYGTVLERLRDGRIVKFFLSPGARTTLDVPYAIAASASDEFADVRFLASAQQTTARRLPRRIRLPSSTPAPASPDDVTDPQIAFAKRLR